MWINLLWTFNCHLCRSMCTSYPLLSNIMLGMLVVGRISSWRYHRLVALWLSRWTCSSFCLSVNRYFLSMLWLRVRWLLMQLWMSVLVSIKCCVVHFRLILHYFLWQAVERQGRGSVLIRRDLRVLDRCGIDLLVRMAQIVAVFPSAWASSPLGQI